MLDESFVFKFYFVQFSFLIVMEILQVFNVVVDRFYKHLTLLDDTLLVLNSTLHFLDHLVIVCVHVDHGTCHINLFKSIFNHSGLVVKCAACLRLHLVIE